MKQMEPNFKARRLVVLLIVAIVSLSVVAYDMAQRESKPAVTPQPTQQASSGQELAIHELAKLPIKGRAPKTGYARTEFGNGWVKHGQCDTRNIILRRDLQDVQVSDTCKVLSGTLHDPYTGTQIEFVRGSGTSDAVQIDHVVALSDAWQTGAQQLSPEQRVSLANDPLELIAVDGQANQQKSDGDAATWLPSNKPFRCQYVARQIAVKRVYSLWLTPAEHDAILAVLESCPDQPMPVK